LTQTFFIHQLFLAVGRRIIHCGHCGVTSGYRAISRGFLWPVCRPPG
jgi:hypothetical protein